MAGAESPVPPLIGRRLELALIQDAFAAALGGRLQIVILAGDSGAGKTRLLAEVAATSRQQGAIVALGGAPILMGADVPFAPIGAMLRELGEQLQDGDLRKLVPANSELAGLLPAAGGTTGPPADVASQLRLFEQFLALLVEVGARRPETPVVIGLEDLHWADASTLALLAYLVANGAHGRVLFVCTVRPGRLTANAQLARLLNEATRRGSVRLVDVGPLSDDESRALVETLGGSQGADRDTADLLARAGGNPLFLEQLARSGTQELPDSLVQLLRDQVGQLSAAAQELLRLAAVVGGPIPAQLLESTATVSDLDVVACLREAREAGLLDVERTQMGEVYAFHHPLLQEVVYSELVPIERARLHGITAHVLQGMVGDHPAQGATLELARHWWAAGELARALPWLLRAAERAEAVYAFAEAHVLLERALASAGVAMPGAARRPIGFRVDRPDEPAIDIGDLLRRAAQAASLAGRPERAIELVDGALAESGELPLLLSRRGQYLWEAGRRADAQAAHERAIEASGSAPSVERAVVLAQAARAWLMASNYPAAKAAAESAVDVARLAGASSEERRALFTLGAARAALGDLAGGAEAIRAAEEAEARSLSESLVRPSPSHVVDAIAGYWSRAALLSRAGEAEASAAAALAGVRRAHELGVEGSWGAFMAATAVMELVEAGRWGDARQLLEQATARTPGTGPPELRAASALLHALSGRIDDAIDELAVARRAAADAEPDPRLSGLLARAAAELALATGQLTEGSAAVQLSMADAALQADPHAEVQLIVLALRILAERLQLARARRSSAEVAALEQEVAIHGLRLDAIRQETASADAGAVFAALLDLGTAEVDRAAGTAHAGRWEALAGSWDALGRPLAATYARWRAAEARLLTRGDRSGVIELLRTGHGAAASLGAAPLLAEIEALARRGRVPLADPDAASPAVEDGRPDDDRLGLSERELEVLVLVAEGLTNRQIAETLFITEKTAGHHVSSILAKLGVASRIEAATVALRLGLAGRPSGMAQQVAGRSVAADIPSPDQVRLTLMFTDLLHAPSAADDRETLRREREWHAQVVEQAVRQHEGQQIDHREDGFFLVFALADAALRCATAVQRAHEQRRRDHGQAPRVRIAVHAAVVTRRGDVVQGRGVHQAASVAGAALGGEILVTTDTFELVTGTYPRREPRQVDGPGFDAAIWVVPVDWRMGSAAPLE